MAAVTCQDLALGPSHYYQGLFKLLAIIERGGCARASPVRKFATVFSQSKNHYQRQLWYQNDQKSVKFNVTVNVRQSRLES